MENTQEFYNNLIKFYETAPANDHTLELVKKNLEECRKRESKLNEEIHKLELENKQQEDLFYIQFDMAKAEAQYYREQYKYTEERLKAVNFNALRAERIDKRNEGLRRQCREYKQKLEDLKHKLRESKNQPRPNSLLKGLSLWIERNFDEGTMLSRDVVLEIIRKNKEFFLEELKK